MPQGYCQDSTTLGRFSRPIRMPFHKAGWMSALPELVN
jgi:hypothetical protein